MDTILSILLTFVLLTNAVTGINPPTKATPQSKTETISKVTPTPTVTPVPTSAPGHVVMPTTSPKATPLPQSIKDYSPKQLRDTINTIDDATAFLNKTFPDLWMSCHMWINNSNNGCLRSAQDILNNRNNSNCAVGRSDIDTMMTYLLSDNYDIGSIYGFRHGTDGGFMPILAANYIFENGKYKVFDPVVGMNGDKGSRNSFILPDATVDSLLDYADLIKADNTMSLAIDELFVVKGGQQINFTDKNSWATITAPNLGEISVLYSNEDHNLSEAEYNEKKYGHIIPENIDKYKLSTMLGGLTLTIPEAKALVGAKPEVIKDKVKTAGDLLLYMLASRMLLQNGDKTINIDNHTWHYNAPAKDTLALNKGNCGRMANLANYLLEGDYQEVGFIAQTYQGNNGGHVYSYIKYQDKYYIVDFSSFLFNNYSTTSQFNVIALDKLEDYGTRWKECYGGLAEIIAYTSTGTDLPLVWEGNYCYYPDGAKFTILYQTDECKVSTLPLDTTKLDWR